MTSTPLSPLISIPIKPTSNVDFTSTLSHTISTLYQESPSSYSSEIQALNRCRQDALRGSAGSELTQRDLLYKYFGQLELLELRFQDVRLPFEWKDAFTGKSISQMSLAYEKASVIFNIASTLSSLAQGQNRSNQDGIKRAFNFLKASAGMFSYINENFLHAPSTDLSRDIVKALVTLMLAQSTEVSLELTKESQKNFRSKVAAQAALLYSQIIEEVKEFTSKGIFERSWSFLVQAKAKYFSALSQYTRALHDVDNKKYGDALTRLSLAEPHIKDSSRFGSSFMAVFVPHTTPTLPIDAATSLMHMITSLQTQITEMFTTLKKENDLIYHAIPPSVPSLPPIEPSQVATPTTIQQIYSTAEVQTVVGPDIFGKLIPLSVHESASLYSEEKAKLVRSIGESCDMADAEYNNGLETLGLPASLAKFKSSSSYESSLSDPGREVKEWCREVKEAEYSQGAVDTQMQELEVEKSKAKGTIARLNTEMETEMRECERARVQYERFEQAPSMGLTKRWREALKGDLEDVGKAEKSDEQLLRLWNEVRGEVGILLMEEEQLEGWFAQQLVGNQRAGQKRNSLLDVGELEEEEERRESDSIKALVESMDEGVSRLGKIKKERVELYKDLKEKIQADDISHILILNRKSPSVEPSLFSTELEKFRPHQNRIAEAIKQQKAALSQLNTEWKTLVESKKGKEVQSKWKEVERRRKELIGRCKHAKEGYWDVRAGLGGALHFYKGLNASLDSLATEVQSFLTSRNKERLQLISEADIQQRLAAPPTPADGGSSTVQKLEHAVASLDIGSKPPLPAKPGQDQRQPSWSVPPPPPPSQPFSPPPPQQQQYPPPPPPSQPQQQSYAPPQSASPYGNIPSTGAFSTQPPPPPPATYTSPPPSTYASATPFSPPPTTYSQPPLPSNYASQYTQQSFPQSPFPPPPQSQPQRSYGLPPPPPPVQQTSLPPPSTPVSYQTSYSTPHPPQPSQYTSPPPPQGYPQYQYPMHQPPPPQQGSYPPPQQQPYSPYGQPPQQQGYGYHGQSR
ncbi:BRO1-domain-containing protein [Atractiella rhizophila]|nr:BRO1-domain-containing protein [Atractiella rhizophila]